MKKNKSGFTLVELLAVIVILAILVTIAVPSTMSISNKLKINMYCSKIDSIESVAKLYGEDRKDSFTKNPTTGLPTATIKVKDLVDTNYLKKDQDTSPIIVDPRDKKSTALYNMSFKVFLKNKRIYVEFNDEVKRTCNKD